MVSHLPPMSQRTAMSLASGATPAILSLFTAAAATEATAVPCQSTPLRWSVFVLASAVHRLTPLTSSTKPLPSSSMLFVDLSPAPPSVPVSPGLDHACAASSVCEKSSPSSSTAIVIPDPVAAPQPRIASMSTSVTQVRPSLAVFGPAQSPPEFSSPHWNGARYGSWAGSRASWRCQLGSARVTRGSALRSLTASRVDWPCAGRTTSIRVPACPRSRVTAADARLCALSSALVPGRYWTRIVVGAGAGAVTEAPARAGTPGSAAATVAAPGTVSASATTAVAQRHRCIRAVPSPIDDPDLLRPESSPPVGWIMRHASERAKGQMVTGGSATACERSTAWYDGCPSLLRQARGWTTGSTRA